MTVFSFNFSYAGARHWIDGKVVKDETGRFVASSPDLFPGYATLAEYMTDATKDFKEGLLLWLENNPDQQPKMPSR